MHETPQTDIGSQLVRIPADASWFDPLPQQVNSAREVHRCCGRTTDQIAESKEVQTWIKSPSG